MAQMQSRSRSRQDPDPPRGDDEGFFSSLLNALATLFVSQSSDRFDPELEETVQSPFAQDTLFRLIGGDPAFVGQSSLVGLLGADAVAPGSGIVFGTGEGSGTDPERLLMHEAGHVFDSRGIDPELLVRVGERFNEARKASPEAYAATNPTEHFAEAFTTGLNTARTLKRLRQAGVPEERREIFLSVADQEVPGSREVAEWMLGQPIFSGARTEQAGGGP